MLIGDHLSRFFWCGCSNSIPNAVAGDGDLEEVDGEGDKDDKDGEVAVEEKAEGTAAVEALFAEDLFRRFTPWRWPPMLRQRSFRSTLLRPSSSARKRRLILSHLPTPKRATPSVRQRVSSSVHRFVFFALEALVALALELAVVVLVRVLRVGTGFSCHPRSACMAMGTGIPKGGQDTGDGGDRCVEGLTEAVATVVLILIIGWQRKALLLVLLQLPPPLRPPNMLASSTGIGRAGGREGEGTVGAAAVAIALCRIVRICAVICCNSWYTAAAAS